MSFVRKRCCTGKKEKIEDALLASILTIYDDKHMERMRDVRGMRNMVTWFDSVCVLLGESFPRLESGS